MKTRYAGVFAVVCVAWVPLMHLAAADVDEFKVKREAVFEFEKKPVVTRDGDNVTIEFTSKGFCDVTVAIEDDAGKIIRHLASGVLGPKAPEPFQKNSKAQKVVWDGKDDKGVYVDDKSRISVRVSLGLKPQFERTLFWDPRKKTSNDAIDWPTFRAAPEGVYVYDGGSAMDHIRLFDHEGNYVRTVYPFPADKIGQVKGISWKTLQPDGQKVPVRPGYQQTTFLTTGTSVQTPSYDSKTGEFKHPSQGKSVAHFGQDGKAATAMAVRNGRIALAGIKLGRLTTDGSPAEFGLEGPMVSFSSDKGFADRQSGVSAWISHQLEGGRFNLNHLMPERAAMSPDGKWVYLTRYAKTIFGSGSYTKSVWDHVVLRLAFDGDKPPLVFAGENGKPGDDPSHFNMPAGIDCDNEGRVYVADYYNNRVQIFSPDGQLLQSAKVDQPAEVAIHKKTGEVYVFCWPLCIPNKLGYDMSRIKGEKPRLVLEKLSAFPKLQRVSVLDLPVARAGEGGGNDLAFRAELDSWSTPTLIWLAPGRVDGKQTDTILVEEKGARLEVRKDFATAVRKAVVRDTAPAYYRQRLAVNPATGKLYICEGTGAGLNTPIGPCKTFGSVLEADPESGRVRQVDLPIDAEDLCFDLDGSAYLRAYAGVVRYEPATWREIPFDYGEEMILGKQKVMGALPIPSNHQGWHQGGIGISPKGHLAIGCLYDLDTKGASVKSRGETIDAGAGRPYLPRLYPGRNTAYNYGAIYVHVWDKHGKLIHDDAIPGVGYTHGICMDGQDNLYVLEVGRRVLDGKNYYNVASCTVMKMKPHAGKVISTAGTPVPVSPEGRPNRSPDLEKTFGQAWVEGADWFYGGIGWDLKKGTGCSCWNARIALDGFARTFAPEIDRNSIAVLDSNGNLILRVGRYGNVDDGKPLAAAGGPPNARSIGGDEVSLMYGMYPAVHSDRRLFVADGGNYRVVSVKLDYAAEEKVPLKDVKDQGK